MKTNGELWGTFNNSLASESLSKLVLAIVAAIRAANNVLIEKESFGQLSTYLERIVPVLKELAKKNISDSESLSNAIENLSQKIKVAKKLAEDCNRKSKVYLLVNCRNIIKRLEDATKEISRAISLMPLASFDLSIGINEDVQKLCDDMLMVEFKAAMAEEEIMEKIESGIQERTVDRSYANTLLTLIAEAVGISTDRTTLKKEFEKFKSEIEDTRLRKDQAEAIQMEQIIALLGRADATSSPKEKEIRYFNKRNSLGSQPLDPLPSFYCPITKEVMIDPVETSSGQTFERSAIEKWFAEGNSCPITKEVMIDPVETSSGQTFERSAIEKWFAEGNSICPLTITPVNPNILRPNKILRQSIEEWTDRNTMITISSLKHKILTDEDQGVLYSLGHLQDICEERDSHREWVVLENYIPLLIKRLGAKNREIKRRALVILCMLARDSEDAKKRIVEVDGAIYSIVRSLGHRNGSKLAVSLLLELSKSDVARNHIGNAQGCILLLVTMSSSDDTESSKDAKDLLENLSFLDQNVILMAKANYFKPLLRLLSSGSEDVRMLMASTLAEMQLSDHGKSALFEDGVLGPLLHLVTDCPPDMKIVAAEALLNLSSLPQNGLKMISEGAVRPLLDQLYRHSSSSKMRELVAAIIMNLAISTSAHESGETQLPLLDTDDDIFRLFSLINLTGPDVQLSILETFYAMCEPPSATDIRSKLRQCSAVQVLVQLCQLDTISIRPKALKLFCCLTEDGDDGMLSQHVDQKCIESLLKIIDTSKDNEEVVSIMGIISNLPRDHIQITQWLLDAEALPIIFKYLGNGDSNGSNRNQIKENAVGALCRFTVKTNLEWQMKVAETGVIPLLVQLLRSGTDLAKRHAAISLSQFSESSYSLSKPIRRSGGLWCFSPPPETGCPVHMGICSVESSFCLVEADAVVPLVRILGESDPGACEAALDALLTLINAERLQSGSKVLAETDAIAGIIRLLSSSSVTVQEKALNAIERLFRLMDLKQKFGAQAQMSLVDITQRGTHPMKSMAGRILAQLNVLPDQSSYF